MSWKQYSLGYRGLPAQASASRHKPPHDVPHMVTHKSLRCKREAPQESCCGAVSLRSPCAHKPAAEPRDREAGGSNRAAGPPLLRPLRSRRLTGAPPSATENLRQGFRAPWKNTVAAPGGRSTAGKQLPGQTAAATAAEPRGRHQSHLSPASAGTFRAGCAG